MKLFISLLAAVVLTACYDPSPTPKPQTEKVSLAVHFVELCSSIKITTDDVGLVAVSNCLGRVRGYADGVTMMAELNKVNHIWCINQHHTDRMLMEKVINWVESNTEQYKRFVDQLDIQTAASAVIIKGLQSGYPCKNT